MKRRAVLGGVAGLASLTAGAGCLRAVGLGDDAPLRLRAMRADPDATDVTCDLSPEVVRATPELQEVLAMADGTPRGEWASMGVSQQVGDRVVGALESHCGEAAGGLYVYRDEVYFVSVTFTSGEDAAAHHGDGHDH